MHFLKLFFKELSNFILWRKEFLHYKFGKLNIVNPIDSILFFAENFFIVMYIKQFY